MSDAARLIRDRQSAQDDRLDRAIGEAPDGDAAILGTTTTVATYPTTASAYYAVALTFLDGVETEGGAATPVVTSVIFYAFNCGTQVPPAGTQIVCHAVGGRWAFRWDG